jgi:pyruvate/2-oxoglutarate dehydrogenase complex dihydrolipoamide acyltransferase (E2) component
LTDEVRDGTRDETTRETVRPATERAEELVDRAARGASYLASLAFLRLMRSASLAREEAEDIWAEAQSLRYRQRQGADPEVGVGDAMETPIRVTEAARRKAEEMGVALAGLQGTGVGGQITVEDVKKRAKAERP